MIQLQSRRTPRVVLALCLTAAAAWMAPAAHATDYCVAPNTSCGGTNVATFQAALDAADNANDADRVFLGAGTYTAPTMTGFNYGIASAPVEITGAGEGQTTLTGQTGGAGHVLFLVAGTSSSVHDLTVRLPENAATGFIGLETDASAQRIEVVEAGTQANTRSGVQLIGGSLEDSTVTLSSGPANVTGVVLSEGGGAIRHSDIQARTAVLSAYGGSVEHSLLHGGTTGISAFSATTTVTDSAISVSAASGTGIVTLNQAGVDGTIDADGVTLIGPDKPASTAVYASNTLGSADNATANVANTVIRGFGKSLVTSGFGTGQANIHTSYSDYDPAGNSDSGPGAISASNPSYVGDGHFVDPADGDYRLRFDSPLIDAGEPGAPTGLTDLGGGARLVDGDSVPGARRDIGAYEYQAQPPTASIAGPTEAQKGAQVSFSGEGSSDADPGDTIVAYAWTIDGAPAGNGSTLDAAFSSPGVHGVGLTVTDSAGRQANATHGVTVTGLAAGPEPTPQGDTTAPVISHLLARPAHARRGRALSFAFSLDEPATVSVKIQRALPGRREGGACRKPTARNRRARRCTRYVLVTALSATGTAGINGVRFSGKAHHRALARGHYRALVSATDTAGNRSAVRRVSFTIV